MSDLNEYPRNHSSDLIGNNTNFTNNLAGLITILIPSCDAYADLWRPCLTLWRRHFRAEGVPIVLGIEEAYVPIDGVMMVQAAKGASWSDCLTAFLRQIETKYVLISLEDFFLRETVSTSRLQMLLQFLIEREGACLRLVRRPGPRRAERVNGVPDIGVLPLGSAYRVSTQAAIWRRDVLLRLLVSGESAWEFELNGSQRADRLFSQGFYGVYRDALPYRHHVVERGKWFPWEAWRFRRMEIGCDFSKREIMSLGASARWLLRKVKDTLLEPMPSIARARLRVILRS